MKDLFPDRPILAISGFKFEIEKVEPAFVVDVVVTGITILIQKRLQFLPQIGRKRGRAGSDENQEKAEAHGRSRDLSAYRGPERDISGEVKRRVSGGRPVPENQLPWPL